MIYSIQDIVDKFENGEERYLNNAVFHQVVYAIANGTDLYKIIDNILLNREELSETIKRILLNCGKPKDTFICSNCKEKIKIL